MRPGSIDRRWPVVRSRRAVGSALVVEGVLREDAVRSASGVSLSVDVGRVGELRESGLVPVEGGVRLSIAGTLFDERMKEWRAGRTVRMPALLREPSTYLNPVP